MPGTLLAPGHPLPKGAPCPAPDETGSRFSGEIAVFTDPSGKPRANTLGIWLDLNLSPRSRDLIDGNRLLPVSG